MMPGQALVTGAASGLGLELCRLLAADSYALIMVDKDAEGLKKAAQSLVETWGIPAQTFTADLGKDGAADELYSRLGQEEIDILINSAGFGLFGYFAEGDWSREEAMLQLHVLNLTRLTKLVVRNMIRRGSGRIMNVSSLAALQPGPLMNIYYASKAYIHFFTEALANELKGTGVTVTVLLPGLFNTNFASTAARYSGAPEKKDNIVTTSVEVVARKALKGMMKGRIRVIPGFSNRLLALAPRLLPRNLMLRAVRRIQESIRKKEA